MKRFPFLDWMRGLAVVLMIQCHVFNSFASMDARASGTYILSQFVGGMAAPLFLFMAGMTFAFHMESLEGREPRAFRRWLICLRRAGYILGIAYLFRFTNWVSTIPAGDWHELTKVDILNCMGLGMIVLAACALFRGRQRARFSALAGLIIAAAAPVVANLPWGDAPAVIREYIASGPGRGRFAFFPCASYIAFGLAAGTVVRRTAGERMDRLMQWSMLIGAGLIFGAHYFSNIPFSLYPKSNFWTDSPALIFIRSGVALALMAATYIWTAYGAAPGWSWMVCLGRNSLMVYWVHVVMVYGALALPVKRTMTIGWAAVSAVVITLLMVGLSASWLAWKARRVRPGAWQGSPSGQPGLVPFRNIGGSVGP